MKIELCKIKGTKNDVKIIFTPENFAEQLQLNYIKVDAKSLCVPCADWENMREKGITISCTVSD